MSNIKLAKNEKILAIRMTSQLLNQLNALAKAKHMGTATVARMALADYITKEAPNALLGATSQPQPQQPTKTKSANPIWDAMSPAERKAHNEEWDY
jgi:hypothetical protein